MTKAALYIRVSSSQQAEEGVSLEAQERALRLYAEREGFDLVDVVVDAGVSASIPLAKREGGKRLLEMVRKGQVQTIIATKLDRVWRSAADALASVETWTKKGVGLVLLDLGGQVLDTKTPMGKLMLTMMAGFAEAERALIAERTRTALQHKKAKGERVSGKAPLGFRFEQDGSLVEDHGEQEVIRKVHSLRAKGFSWSKIADGLNKAGVPCRGAKWFAQSLRLSLAAA